MSRQVEFRPLASADIAGAFSWYATESEELAMAFEAELGRTVALIATFPAAAPVVHRNLRRALLHRFPYAVYYVEHQERLVIRAVLHTRVDPETWRRRA